MISRPKVYFFFEGITISLKNRARIKEIVELIFKKEKKKLNHVSYIFCTDKALLSINKKYLNHSYYTDVISFDLSEDQERIWGEVYISIDRVRENAEIFNIPFSKELRKVIFHGALHLCGYKDKQASEKKKMQKKEDFYLALF